MHTAWAEIRAKYILSQRLADLESGAVIVSSLPLDLGDPYRGMLLRMALEWERSPEDVVREGVQAAWDRFKREKLPPCEDEYGDTPVICFLRESHGSALGADVITDEDEV